MVDRRPQDHPAGEPDGVTDNTAAIQAAIDAWQPGDRVVIEGGDDFRTSARLEVTTPGLVMVGDGAIRAMGPLFSPGAAMLRIAADDVALDLDGMRLDQNTNLDSGRSILIDGAAGVRILGLVSRQTVFAAVELLDDVTDLVIDELDHQGGGYGVLAVDRTGIAALRIRRSTFVHSGAGAVGDGIEIIGAPGAGADDVEVVGCSARDQIGEASNAGIGFGFARVTNLRLVGCLAQDCESDGFHLEQGSNGALIADCRAIGVGVEAPVGGNGSGIAAYDCDDVAVVLCLVQGAGLHGIALSGQGSVAERTGGLIERCTIDTTRRDGIHVTAQKDFRIDRNRIRDPSLGNPDAFAGIHVGRQGGTTLENVDGSGSGNVVVLSGTTTPLAEIHVRENSLDVVIDGVSGAGERRVTGAGETRTTEAGETRALEIA